MQRLDDKWQGVRQCLKACGMQMLLAALWLELSMCQTATEAGAQGQHSQ